MSHLWKLDNLGENFGPRTVSTSDVCPSAYPTDACMKAKKTKELDPSHNKVMKKKAE